VVKSKGEKQKYEVEVKGPATPTPSTPHSWCFEECSAPVAAFFGHKP
jgi:hypothetical protein